MDRPGSTVNLSLAARVLSNGAPQNNVKVNFTVVSGSGALSAASAQSNSLGYATVTLTVAQLAALVQVSACVAPGNVPCQAIYANPVALANQVLQPVAGSGQVSIGPGLQPVTVRVTDSSLPPNSVIAASVWFLTTVPARERAGYSRRSLRDHDSLPLRKQKPCGASLGGQPRAAVPTQTNEPDTRYFFTH